MVKVLFACVWLLGPAFCGVAQAASVVFLNPGMSTETFWVSYAQFMQAAAKDLGLDLRVRYGERDLHTHHIGPGPGGTARPRAAGLSGAGQ
jgi:ABC-type sugar transport system substrate-binding protein